MNEVGPTGLLDVSVVIPVRNERESLSELHRRLTEALAATGCTYEVVLVDDGSTDGSGQLADQIAAADDHAVSIQLRRNFGKAVALQTGFQAARGQVIVTMDGDLQDDPGEIHRFLDAIRDADVVSGWKQDRQDPLSKTIPSKVFNAVTSALTGVSLRDFNCGFKAYRREVVQSLDLYGELHRYIPVLAHAKGFRITEIGVHHLPRLHGRSKYGRERLVRGAFDLMTVLLLSVYRYRPLHLFGAAGILLSLSGFAIDMYLAVLWFMGERPIGDRPLLTLGTLLIIMGIQALAFGLLAEMITAATYRRSDVMGLVRSVRRQSEPAETERPNGCGWRPACRLTDCVTLWRAFRAPVTVLALAAMFLALAQYVSAHWSLLVRHDWQADWTWIAASVAATTLFFAVSAGAWRTTLTWIGLDVSRVDGLWAWSRSSLARYLPTPVWATGSRIYVTTRLGTGWRGAAFCYAIELGGSTAAALGLALLGLPWWVGAQPLTAVALAAGAAFVALPLIVYLALRREPFRLATSLPGPGQLALWSGTYVVALLLYGSAHILVLQALRVPLPPLLAVIGVSSLAWALGTLNVFSPSGLGTRELVLIWGLQSFVDPPELLVLSATIRLAAVAGELILFAALFLWTRRSGRVRAQESTEGV